MSLSKALAAAAGNAGAAGESLYVEDVFSTYLYTGTSANQSIINGIDLAGEGGMVWTKRRDNSQLHGLFDTERGVLKYISSDRTDAETTKSNTLKAFYSDGFQLGGESFPTSNSNAEKGVSWTFRKAEKFFDVVTYTGDGVAGREIAHNLGSVPACIVVKRTDSTSPWIVYHSSIGNNKILQLEATLAAQTFAHWYNTNPTSSVFTVNSFNAMNASGGSYVAYVFASDAGGFGDDGSESIIKCGSYTADGSGNASVNLGFEPQWLLVKSSTALENWIIIDNMRGLVVGGSDPTLYANLTNSEYSAADSNRVNINATGFETIANRFNVSTANQTYIYIAIRRPMKTPESGTEVFTPYLPTVYEDPYWKSSFPVVDFVLGRWNTNTSGENILAFDRLRGSGVALETNTTDSESGAAGDGSSYISSMVFDRMYGFHTTTTFSPSTPDITWMFKRATGFFDVVAYIGTGTVMTIPHNLGAIPELIIVRRRDNTTTTQGQWKVYTAPTGNQKYLTLENNNSLSSVQNTWQSTTPTSEEFYLGTGSNVVNNSGKFIAYLFATLAGVSKVGSYTGNNLDTTIDCGFSNGARFVMIKRTDSTGDWTVFDTARGWSTSTDYWLDLNNTNAEASGNTLTVRSAGFGVRGSPYDAASLNVSGATYIYLAIA